MTELPNLNDHRMNAHNELEIIEATAENIAVHAKGIREGYEQFKLGRLSPESYAELLTIEDTLRDLMYRIEELNTFSKAELMAAERKAAHEAFVAEYGDDAQDLPF